jgi:hypothetical protein
MNGVIGPEQIFQSTPPGGQPRGNQSPVTEAFGAGESDDGVNRINGKNFFLHKLLSL